MANVILGDVKKYNLRWKMTTGINNLCRKMKITNEQRWEYIRKYSGDPEATSMDVLTDEQMNELLADLAWSLYER